MGWLTNIFQWIFNTLKGLALSLRLVWRLIWDRRVSLFLKPLALGPILYVVLWNRNLIPNSVGRGLGLIDDLFVFYILLRLFILLSPAAVVAEHLREMSSPPKRYEEKSDFRREDVIEGSSHPPDPKQGAPDPQGKPKDT